MPQLTRLLRPMRLLRLPLGTRALSAWATLDLQFARDKALDPRVTFTRASSGTYFDADGVLQAATSDVARFDHDPETGESLGLLVEEERTNLLLWSEDFNQNPWATVNSSNVDTKLVSDSGVVGYAQQTPSELTGTYTLSVFAKAAEWNWLILWVYDGVSASVYDFDLNTGQSVDGEITSVGDGWYRCSVTVSLLGGTFSGRVRLYPNDQEGPSVTVGDGTSGIYIRNVQLEEGSFPTSYIPTTDATVTREADVAVIDGDDFAEWYRQDEGTVFVDFDTGIPDDTQFCFAFAITDPNIANHYITVRNSIGYTPDRLFGMIRNSGTVVFTSEASGQNGFLEFPLPRVKAALGFAKDNMAISLNNTKFYSDDSGDIPAVTQLNIGAVDNQGDFNLNGHIARLAYYPKRLPNAELEKITS